MQGRKSQRLQEKKKVEPKKRKAREDTNSLKRAKNDSIVTKKRKRTQQRVEIVVENDDSTEEEVESEDDDNFEESESDEKSEASCSEEESEEESEDKESEEEDYRSTSKRRVQRKKQSRPISKPRKKKPMVAPNRTIQRVNQSATVIPLRKVNHQENASLSSYALARERLHVSAVPDSLPCREEEFMSISGYLESAIQESTGTCIYISGVPGTGKTATVHEVIRHLQQQAEEENIPYFDFAEINGMKLTDPNQAYSILWDCINKPNDTEKRRKYTAAHAQQLLEAKFSKPNEDQRVTVVLMDELDLLVTKKQTVMYNFFDWPSRPLSKLIVVAIANTMDLPERLMSNKIASRMGLTRINFQPYRYDQLIQIVQSRLEGIDAFAKEAIEFAARKVSAVSGDARRALDICRRAVEIVEQRSIATVTDSTNEKKMQVTIAVIDGAIKEMFTSPSVAFIRSCSLHQKIFLVSCMQRSRAVGMAEIEFGDVAHYHVQTCKWHNIEPLNTSDLMRICESLGQSRALVMEGGRMDIYMRISLNLMEEDIVMACKADKLISKLLQNLPTANM